MTYTSNISINRHIQYNKLYTYTINYVSNPFHWNWNISPNKKKRKRIRAHFNNVQYRDRVCTYRINIGQYLFFSYHSWICIYVYGFCPLYSVHLPSRKYVYNFQMRSDMPPQNIGNNPKNLVQLAAFYTIHKVSEQRLNGKWKIQNTYNRHITRAWNKCKRKKKSEIHNHPPFHSTDLALAPFVELGSLGPACLFHVYCQRNWLEICLVNRIYICGAVERPNSTSFWSENHDYFVMHIVCLDWRDRTSPICIAPPYGYYVYFVIEYRVL